MTTFSQQPDYSTILSSDDIITISNDYCSSNNIDTINNMPSVAYTYDFNSSDTITLSGINSTSFNWDDFNQTEFVNCFPNWGEVERMRKEYPALDIALKKFQEVYKMVEDDWDAKHGRKYGNNSL